MLPLPIGREANQGVDAPPYVRHRPERTLLYQLVEEYYPRFEAQCAFEGRVLPDHVRQEFEDYLKCGRLEHGFLRVRCRDCKHEHLVAFSCKRRGFCPSCGARRMVESAALLVDEVLPEAPIRQWVLSFPFQLRFLFASRPRIMGQVLGIVYRVIATHLIAMEGMYAGFAGAKTGDQKGWSDPQDGPHWCSHADSLGTSLYPTLRAACGYGDWQSCQSLNGLDRR
jgi:ribosomal protein S27E